MVYTNGLKSPRDESNFSTFHSPSRTIGGQIPSNMPSSTAERASLHRRFTTNAVPTLPTLSSLSPLSPIGQQRRQAAEPQSDLTSSVSTSLSCSTQCNGGERSWLSKCNIRALCVRPLLVKRKRRGRNGRGE